MHSTFFADIVLVLSGGEESPSLNRILSSKEVAKQGGIIDEANDYE